MSMWTRAISLRRSADFAVSPSDIVTVSLPLPLLDKLYHRTPPLGERAENAGNPIFPLCLVNSSSSEPVVRVIGRVSGTKKSQIVYSGPARQPDRYASSDAGRQGCHASPFGNPNYIARRQSHGERRRNRARRFLGRRAIRKRRCGPEGCGPLVGCWPSPMIVLPDICK